jgi:hypothetical protein
MDEANFRKNLFKLGLAILATNLVAGLPQVASARSTAECDRIYNSDTTTWSRENRRAYKFKQQVCYSRAPQQIASTATNYTIRQKNLRKAMSRVQNEHFRRNGAFIEINSNNVSEMMRNIGATPAEREFVTEQMSLYL